MLNSPYFLCLAWLQDCCTAPGWLHGGLGQRSSRSFVRSAANGAMAMLAGIVLLAVTACTLVGSILESESFLLGKQGPGSGQGSGQGDESLQVSELYYIIHVILPKGFTSDLCSTCRQTFYRCAPTMSYWHSMALKWFAGDSVRMISMSSQPVTDDSQFPVKRI